MGAKFIIYALTDPDGAVRYIGKSCSGLARPRRHGHPSELAKDVGYKGNWIRSLREQGQDFGIRVLEEVSDEAQLSAREIAWIAEGRAQGWRLTNLTDGGDGLRGVKRGPFSEEWKRKLSEAHRGKTHSAETRAKMSAAHTGKPKAPEAAKKSGEARRGRRLSDEMKERIRNTLKGRKPPPQSWMNSVAVTKGRPLSQEHREKIRAALKGRVIPDEARARSAAARRGLPWSAQRRAAFEARRVARGS